MKLDKKLWRQNRFEVKLSLIAEAPLVDEDSYGLGNIEKDDGQNMENVYSGQTGWSVGREST